MPRHRVLNPRPLLPWLLPIAGLGLYCAPALAERADRDKPIQVEANHASVDDKQGVNLFEGNVVITQGTLTIRAEAVRVRQDKAGNQFVAAQGRPIKMRQKLEAAGEWVEGEAQKLDYDNQSGQLKLYSQAWLKRGRDEVRGDYIFFDTVSEHYQAQGSAPGSATPGRVTVTLQPKPRSGGQP